MSVDSTLSANRPKPAKKKSEKPSKPYPEFPLFAHGNGQWAKKIRGKLNYFGLWEDPEGALAKYQEERDDLHAGRQPRQDTCGTTISDACNRFLTCKRNLLNEGEITDRSFRDYYTTCERVVEAFTKTRLVDDLTPQDFGKLRTSIAEKRGPVALGNEIGRVRMIFKFALDERLIERSVNYGQGFKKPTAKVLRKTRAAKGKRMFEAADLRQMIDGTGVPLKAMLLLGINCGFGQSDIACLPQSALDLENGWIDFPRPKTGVARRCPLWPETIEALRDAIAMRPAHKDDADADLTFLTKYSNRWVRTVASDDPKKQGAAIDSVAQEVRKLLKSLDLKVGLNFYALRHTFETVGGESRDQVAVDHIMGHIRNDMASVYREGVSDERLQLVVKVIHEWLF